MIVRPMWMRAFFALLASCLALAIPHTAFAADAEDDEDVVVEEVVVTGSRVKRSDFTSASPITVMTGQSIVESGFANLGEALRSQAVAGSAGFNQSSILSGGGSTSVDLRNLGQSRVLVLVNGKRVASFADALQNQAVDLSFVPTAMIERVDILRDGASAAYGADAISGVINIILKENFEGVEMGASVGESGEGDGQRYEFDMALGTTSDRGSLVLGMEYRYQDGVRQRDRDWAFPSVSGLSGAGATNGSSLGPGGTFFDNSGQIYCTQPKAFGGNEIDNIFPNCPQFLTNQQVSSQSQIQLLRYDYALNQDVFGESEVYTAAGYGVYEIFEGVEGFLEVEYAKRQSEFDLDGNPAAGVFSSTPSYPSGVVVPGTNPNLPPGYTGGQFWFRPTSTVGRRQSEHESDTIRMVAGLRGDIVSDGFLNEWSWELSYLYTRVDADLRTDSTWNLGRFLRISDPAQCAIDPLCASVVNPSGALDVIRPGNWTAQEVQYLRQNAIARSEYQTSGWFGLATGPIFELPAGDVQLAIGFETRTDRGFSKPDPITEAGESIANQTFTTNGEFSVDEYFAEIDVPLVADVFMAESLDLNVQFRSSDYDTFGEETVWRVGLNWQMFDWLRVRGSVSTAYRAPQVTDLFNGGTVSFDGITHSCADPSQRTPGSTVDQNCAALGVPLGAMQTAGQSPVLAGGNPNLEPETADTSTVGVVLTPGGFLDGLSISVDVWDIEVDDLITRPTSNSIVADCFGSAGLTDPTCGQFTTVYDPGTNIVSTVDFTNRLINSSNVSTNGFDWAIRYEFDGFADTLWNLDLNGTYVDENTFAPGAGNYDSNSRTSIVRLKSNFVATVDWEAFDFTWRSRYIHGLNDRRFKADDNVFGYSGVDSHLEHDIRVGWNYDNYRLVFGVNDIFDEDPPYALNLGSNTDLFLYDSMGRYLFFRATMSM